MRISENPEIEANYMNKANFRWGGGGGGGGEGRGAETTKNKVTVFRKMRYGKYPDYIGLIKRPATAEFP